MGEKEILIDETPKVIPAVCARHCSVREGVDHHWTPDCPEDGEPVMVCKHCDAVREIEDDEDDF